MTPDTTALAQLLSEIETGRRTFATVPSTFKVAHLLVEDKELLLALAKWALEAREALEQIKSGRCTECIAGDDAGGMPCDDCGASGVLLPIDMSLIASKALALDPLSGN